MTELKILNAGRLTDYGKGTVGNRTVPKSVWSADGAGQNKVEQKCPADSPRRTKDPRDVVPGWSRNLKPWVADGSGQNFSVKCTRRTGHGPEHVGTEQPLTTVIRQK